MTPERSTTRRDVDVEIGWSSPQTVAAVIAAAPRPWLICLDVDGTLAPIAPRPEGAHLVSGARRALTALDDLDDVTVAIVSGRSLDDLEVHFRLPQRLVLVGSHGAETSSSLGRTESETARLAAVHTVLDQAATGLPGAWVESKAFGAAFHVRQADPVAAAAVIEHLRELFDRHGDLTVQPGHAVLEVAVRHTSKADAIDRLRVATRAGTVVFVGDDATDEHGFERLAGIGPGGIGVKVGAGPTAATWRVVDPVEVVELLIELVRVAAG